MELGRGERAGVEAELQRLESGKWRPASIGGVDAMVALFADDFVTVEYGSNPHGGVYRNVDGTAMLKTPAAAQLAAMLDATAFTLGEWHFIHAADGVVVASYRVAAAALGWQAYATSVWARRDGRWQTLFYQASTAK